MADARGRRPTARSRCPTGPRCSTRAVPRASTCRRCASARRSPRRTPAASASSSSKAAACSCPPARGRRRRHGRAHRTPIAPHTPASSCSSCSPRRPTSTGRRTSRRGSTSTAPTPSGSATTSATVHQPATVDNDLYVRDYGRCILCYKCVDACGEQWQNTFAISVAGRGFDAHISTEWDVGCPTRPACTAATASRCARPARSRRRPSSTCATRVMGRDPPDRHRRRSAPTAASVATSSCTCRTTRS